MYHHLVRAIGLAGLLATTLIPTASAALFQAGPAAGATAQAGLSQVAAVRSEEPPGPTLIPTRTILTKVKVYAEPCTTPLCTGLTGLGTLVSGRVVAESAPPGVAADLSGYFKIEVAMPAWTLLLGPVPVDASGRFSQTLIPYEPPAGAHLRATYLGSQVYAPSSSLDWVTATVPPTVKVKVVQSGSKLRVNVNPNLVTGNWRFTVRAGYPNAFRWVGLFATKGAKEVRTVDLPAGTYHVYVYAQRAMASATSRVVTITR